MSKTFQGQIKEFKLNTNAKIKSFLRGKTIKVVNTSGGHNYGAVGETTKLSNVSNSTSSYLSQGFPGGNTIYYYEFVVLTEETVEDLNENIKRLKKDKKDIDAEIKTVEAKIEFMKTNSLEKYDEDEFKVFQTLQTLDDASTTAMEKAKIIAKLIRG